MPAAALPPNEDARLAVLRSLGVLDTPPDEDFDALARAAALVCGTPVALISLVDARRQWFKANVGLAGAFETHRDLAFCGHAILGDGLLEVEDARQDPRFVDNALVTGQPEIRFYAGAPLVLGGSSAMGTLCVIDTRPRRLDKTQRETLLCLAEAAAAALEGRRARRAEQLLTAELERNLERRAEAAERESAVFRNSPDILLIVHVDYDGDAAAFRYEAISPALAPITGWRPEDWIGRSPAACLPASSAGLVLAEYQNCLAQGGTIAYQATVATPNGARDFDCSLTPVRSPANGRVVRLAETMRDVTERNRLEAVARQGQKMEAIGRLASGVAHDFNNILQSISASLEIIEAEAPANSRVSEFAAIGLRSARRGSYLTHHLLAYARQQMLRPRVIELPLLLSDAEKLLARTLGPGIAISVHADAAAKYVLVDPGQMQTALLNLAINAAHAMPKGGALVIETRALVDDRGRWACVAVTDTGFGMDQATLEQAAEPFFTTKGLNGTGLGLSMVHGFAEQSGGQLRIASAVGRGTTVTLQLPAAEKPLLKVPAKAPVARAHSGATVLLVDDDRDVLLTIGAFMEMAGFVIVPANGAADALAQLANGARVDVLVTDFAMPDLNGGDLIKRARSLRGRLPAVVISGFTDLEDVQALGADIRVLHKPFERRALIGAVRDLLGLETAR